MNLGLPIFFIQKRPGKNGVPFSLIKFRTMKNIFREDGDLEKDNFRQTRLGNFLRKTSLDELPELINILKGDMSFIGPRPLLIEYLKLYNKRHKKRHNVKPGISGLAQINGRNSIDWKTRLDYDIYYVENFSIWLDMKIFIKTFKVLLNQEGINHKDNFSMPPFEGLD
tara:strand:- start:494 stop:997 length:504 start_codon:yes stop_codon:yes gene_type:complete